MLETFGACGFFFLPPDCPILSFILFFILCIIIFVLAGSIPQFTLVHYIIKAAVWERVPKKIYTPFLSLQTGEGSDSLDQKSRTEIGAAFASFSYKDSSTFSLLGW